MSNLTAASSSTKVSLSDDISLAVLRFLSAADIANWNRTSRENKSLGNDSALWSGLLSRDFTVSATRGDPKEAYRAEHLKQHNWDNMPRTSIQTVIFYSCSEALKQSCSASSMRGLKIRCIMVG